LWRSGWACGTAVGGVQCGFDIIGVPFSGADQRQSTGDVAHLMMQE
jgi:hypothetical protein